MVERLLTIDADLLAMLQSLEPAADATFPSGVVTRIFVDSQKDQVNEKHYVLYERPASLFRAGLSIVGKVDEYEPETIWIQVTGSKAIESRCQMALARPSGPGLSD